jgi:hypothetical protein
MHESVIRQRLLETRFSLAEVPRPLVEVDELLQELPRRGSVAGCEELCLESARVKDDGARVYCVARGRDEACVAAREVDGATRFSSEQPLALPPGLVAQLWALVDAPGAGLAQAADDADVPELAEQEAQRFTPRLSFVAGARTATVASPGAPSFAVGGQLGLRYWASLYVVPGVAVEVGNVLQQARSFVTAALQGRVELTLWASENRWFLNLPGVSFLMAAMPVLGFGHSVAIGGRALIGAHLTHLGRYPTPFFFEVGFQVLTVDGLDASGFRVGVGVGL